MTSLASIFYKRLSVRHVNVKSAHKTYIDFLQRSIDMVMKQFIPPIPVFHLPTFTLEDCEPILLLTMASVGALFIRQKFAVSKVR